MTKNIATQPKVAAKKPVGRPRRVQVIDGVLTAWDAKNKVAVPLKVNVKDISRLNRFSLSVEHIGNSLFVYAVATKAAAEVDGIPERTKTRLENVVLGLAKFTEAGLIRVDHANENPLDFMKSNLKLDSTVGEFAEAVAALAK